MEISTWCVAIPLLQVQAVELDNTHLQSSLTFTFSNQIAINCTDNEAYTSSITIHIEGIFSSIT